MTAAAAVLDRSAQTARELRWLLLSPPLLDTAPGAHAAAVQQFSAAEQAAIAQWLDGIDRAPQALCEFVQRPAGATKNRRALSLLTPLSTPLLTLSSTLLSTPPSTPLTPVPASSPTPTLRLGRRAERLMEFFLRHGPTHRLVAANIALRHAAPNGDRTTLGEIDFLLHDAAGHAWHWELAVKFFLCDTPNAHATALDFIGPDRAETLDTKLRKLFDRQLRHTPPAPWHTERWTPAACTRGWLFYRHGSRVPHTPGVHPQHLQGVWIERDRIDELDAAGATVWQAVPRSDWMCPQPPWPGAGRSLHAIASDIDATARGMATMVVRGDGVDCRPVFVISPRPATATDAAEPTAR